jgi:hypothetical protein
VAARRSGLKVIKIPKISTETPNRTKINNKNLRVINASIENLVGRFAGLARLPVCQLDGWTVGRKT